MEIKTWKVSLCARIPVFGDHVLCREFESKTNCSAVYISIRSSLLLRSGEPGNVAPLYYTEL